MADRAADMRCIHIYIGEIDYRSAWDMQKELVALRRRKEIPNILLLLQHPSTITIGKSGKEEHLLVDSLSLNLKGIDLVLTDRGGDITYHGPGQLIGYPIMDLCGLKKDIFWYLRQLEQVIMNTLLQFGISGYRKEGYTGVWVGNEKIAAIGVKVSRWITSHGFAFNIAPRLELFDLIVPCGIKGISVTSMAKLVGATDFAAVSRQAITQFGVVFEQRMTPYNHASWPILNDIIQAHTGNEIQVGLSPGG